MSINLPEFRKVHGTGIGSQDEGAPDMSREGVLGQTLPAGILAEGRKEASIRRGYSLDSASRNKKLR